MSVAIGTRNWNPHPTRVADPAPSACTLPAVKTESTKRVCECVATKGRRGGGAFWVCVWLRKQLKVLGALTKSVCGYVSN